MNRSNVSRRCLVLALAGAAAAHAVAQTPNPAAPKVDGAWARPTVQGQQAGGAFVKITGGTAADKLLGVRSEAAQMMQIHKMEMVGDTMRMRENGPLDLAPGQTVELKPGGLHLMFMGLKQPLQAGTRVPVQLRFEKAGEVTVEFLVSPQAPK